jgi:membrane protease YdiL (CAAX protease family)
MSGPETSFPSRRALLATWVALVVLTLVTAVAGGTLLQADPAAPLGLVSAALLLLAAGLKARLILTRYLNLRVAGEGWRFLFTVWVGLVLLVVLVIVYGPMLASAINSFS